MSNPLGGFEDRFKGAASTPSLLAQFIILADDLSGSLRSPSPW
jgi:hypothetical protein